MEAQQLAEVDFRFAGAEDAAEIVALVSQSRKTNENMEFSNVQARGGSRSLIREPKKPLDPKQVEGTIRFHALGVFTSVSFLYIVGLPMGVRASVHSVVGTRVETIPVLSHDTAYHRCRPTSSVQQ